MCVLQNLELLLEHALLLEDAHLEALVEQLKEQVGVQELSDRDEVVCSARVHFYCVP